MDAPATSAAKNKRNRVFVMTFVFSFFTEGARRPLPSLGGGV